MCITEMGLKYWNYICSKRFTLFDTDDTIMDKDIAFLMRNNQSRDNYLRAVERLRNHATEETSADITGRITFLKIVLEKSSYKIPLAVEKLIPRRTLMKLLLKKGVPSSSVL